MVSPHLILSWSDAIRRVLLRQVGGEQEFRLMWPAASKQECDSPQGRAYNGLMADKRKTSRRQFLKGESAVEAFGDMTHGTVPEPATVKRQPITPTDGVTENSSAALEQQETAEPSGTYLLNFSRQAMACQFAIFLNAGQFHDGPERAFEALDLVEQLEDQMTVYRDHSEITRLNRTAAEYPVIVESQLYDLLRQSQQLHKDTQWSVRHHVGPALQSLGILPARRPVT